MAVVRHLEWDEWNEGHIARHGLSKDDVEEACRRLPMNLAAHSGRILLVGPNNDGNLLAVVLAPLDEPDALYVVTARPAGRTERRAFRAWLEEQP